MNPGRVVFGGLVAALGVILFLDSTGAIDGGRVVGRWWPVVIVALGALQLRRRATSRAGAVLVAAGLGLLAVTTGVLGDDGWRYVWPAALVIAGLWIVLGWGRRFGSQPGDDEVVDGIAVLGSARLGTRSQSFRRAAITAVLGGVTLDLTDALPATGATVTVTCVLGGAAILVPRGWVVEVRGLPLLGGWDNTTDRLSVPPDAPRLEVQALVLLGGVEVKHPTGRWR